MKLETDEIEDYLQNYQKLKDIYMHTRKNIIEQLLTLDLLESTLYMPARITDNGGVSSGSLSSTDSVGRIVTSAEAEKIRQERKNLFEMLKHIDDKIASIIRVLSVFNALALTFPYHHHIINRLWINKEKVAYVRREAELGMDKMMSMKKDFVKVIAAITNSECVISDLDDMEKIKNIVNDDELIDRMRR